MKARISQILKSLSVINSMLDGKSWADMDKDLLDIKEDLERELEELENNDMDN